ncbi:MAG: formate dehydrogenase [Proteobacteria bacterium]|nr:formate dehydrogenase [Pseudomonadota bacterium]
MSKDKSLTTGPIRGEAGISGWTPFGLGRTKPHHFLEMAGVALENIDNLGYAWRILNHGVCDGCSLGPRGLEDDVIEGVHLCMSRLKLLRNNTIAPFSEADVADIERLRQMTNQELRELGRVPYPFIYKPGTRGFRRISWEEALNTIGEQLSAIPPERQAYFATSKGLTNETYYAFTKTARLMGTNNVDFCARLCHAATVAGLSRTIGVGAPTISLKDLIGTDLILLWGTNLANNQPVSVKYLHHAKEAGTRIVSINSVEEKGLNNYWIPSITKSALFGTKLADDFIKVRVGGDLALMNGVMKLLVEKDALNQAYIDKNTEGWEELKAHLAEQDMGELLIRSGVSMEDMEWLATLIARAKTMVTVYSMGLTQHKFGTENVMGVVNLHLAKGAIGCTHSGILPIRGHSGVQGGGECGVTPTKYPGGFIVNEENAARFSELWGHSVPFSKGLSTGPMLMAAHAGEIDFFYNLGGNLVETMPRPQWVKEAFERVRLRIHQDININTSMLVDPAEAVILLPAQTRYEQRGGGTSTSTERRIRFSPEIPGHPIVGETKPEWEIPGLIAAAANPNLKEALCFPSSQSIRDEMAKVMPVYEKINTLTREGDHWQWGGPQLCRDGDFAKMPNGKARFSVLQAPDTRLPEGLFKMTTRRGKQFNSMVFANQDTLQGGKERNDVFLSLEDAQRLSIQEGDSVALKNEYGHFKGLARVVNMAQGFLQTYWPESNVLIPPEWDPLSEEPDYNCLVELERL